VQLQPLWGDSIFAKPPHQYFVVRKVLGQVHGGGEDFF
jgi:hypothetical protein